MKLNVPVLLCAVLVVQGATFVSAGEDAQAESQKLVDVLRSGAVLHDKARACQRLGEIGTKDAVPVLAGLLSDPQLEAYARSGLENIPDPSAVAALRAALDTTSGLQRTGIVNSLGVLRDLPSTAALCKLAEDSDSSVSKEALLALGRIGSADAIACIQKALGAVPESYRNAAAAACLLAADALRIKGQLAEASALFDRVRNAQVAFPFRVGATRGAIVSRQAAGIPLLMEQLRSPDRVQRHIALLVIREIPSEALADALNAELDGAPAELQVQLISALADCHNSKSAQAVNAKLSADNPDVRSAAVQYFCKVPDPSGAAVLLQVVSGNKNQKDVSAAAHILERSSQAGLDALLLKELQASPPTEYRLQLIRLLGLRVAPAATTELLKQAADADTTVAEEAYRALERLVSIKELPELIALTKGCKNESTRSAAESAVYAACRSSGALEQGGDALLSELKKSTDAADTCSWIRVLCSLGHKPGLPALTAALNDANEQIAACAIASLGRWPGPEPVAAMLEVAEKHANAGLRQRALKAALKLSVVALDKNQCNGETAIALFKRASQSAQFVEDKRMLISGLGRIKLVESFALLQSFLDDPKLQAEVSLAIVQIAPDLAGKADSATLKKVLEKIAAESKNEDVRKKATELSRSIKAEAGAVQRGNPVQLFDGRTLEGWQGNEKVWRVRDGVIVGGSMDGNPRNEFLATTKSYSNFNLRVEYKLVGTAGFINAGVQFRSVRIPKPDNEMKGYQADIGAGHSGCLYDESRRNKFLMRATAEQIKRLEKPGDWNTLDLRCVKTHIQILLNGELTIDYTEPDAQIPQDGLIGLQMHGGCKAEVSYRNISIEVLP